MTRAEKERLVELLEIESFRYQIRCEDAEEHKKYFLGMVDGIEHCIDIIADMEETN